MDTGTPVDWLRFVGFSLRIGLLFVPMLLLPSLAGWWLGGFLASRLRFGFGASKACRGAFAGLVAFIAHVLMVGDFFPLSIVAVPVGAFFGWLIFGIVFPMPPQLRTPDKG